MKIKVFTDFDGTLSLDDTGVLLIDDHRAMGPDRRRMLDHKILNGETTYREAVQEMWDSVHMTWEEAWSDHLRDCRIDPGFPLFFDYCQAQNIPVTVISSGIYPVVSRVLEKFLAEKAERIEIVCNHGDITDRQWKITWRDDSEFGNDKSKTLRAARDDNTLLVFCGDGVSDISAARHADLLFARRGRDLETYCGRESIPFISFDTFDIVKDTLQSVLEGKTRVEKDAATGFSKIVPV